MSRYTALKFFFLVIISFLILMPLPVKAQSQYVYLVKASNCTNAPVQRALTGFRMRGVKGIITSLHGVADSRTITVTSIGGVHGNGVVTVYSVDIAHDLARLSSPLFEALPTDGFVPAPTVNWQKLNSVRVIGYPLGLDLEGLNTVLTVGTPPLKRLKNLVDAYTRLHLVSRGSPEPSQLVLYLEGFLYPGHSGSPVLNGAGQVVAVADGGLNPGIGWAIPWNSRAWKPASKNSQLEALRRKGTDRLFSFETETAVVEKRIENVQSQINNVKNTTNQLEQKTNQIATSVAPRRLTDEQTKQLVEILKAGPKGKINIDYTFGDGEAEFYAIQLCNALASAGWEVIGPSGTIIVGRINIGLHIQVRSVQTAPGCAGILQKALARVGLKAVGDEMSGMQNDDVDLFVGLKP